MSKSAAEQFGSECRWLSWKLIYCVGFSTVRWDSETSPGLQGSSRTAVAMRNILELGGDLLLGFFCTLLTTYLQKVFPFISNSQAKCHSQPLPPSSVSKGRLQVPRCWCATSGTFCSCFLLLGNVRMWIWGRFSCSGHLFAHWSEDCLMQSLLFAEPAFTCVFTLFIASQTPYKDPCWHLAMRVSLPMGTQAHTCVHF